MKIRSRRPVLSSVYSALDTSVKLTRLRSNHFSHARVILCLYSRVGCFLFFVLGGVYRADDIVRDDVIIGAATGDKRRRGGKTNKNNRNDIWHTARWFFHWNISFRLYYYIRTIIISQLTRLCQKFARLHDDVPVSRLSIINFYSRACCATFAFDLKTNLGGRVRNIKV